MNENIEITDDTKTVETAPAERTKRRRTIIAAASIALVVTAGGYALHQQGVHTGQTRADHAAMTELQALQIRGDARSAAARRETRIPDYMRAAAGVTAAENKLFGWTAPDTGCRFIRTPEGRIFQDAGSVDLREVLDELPTQSCQTAAPTVDQVSVGGRPGCTTVVRVGGVQWALPPDHVAGEMQKLNPGDTGQSGCREAPTPR
ncbi:MULTISPECIES: hypothetical protein [Mycobacteriaceae]|uniref:hypothetical protein n=1 Tax=Mycobacteriaceae TaxID=1762 RepID=UPI0007EFD4E2|nr:MULTISPECIES: hypothetical protein [Mycobacteriaceae]MDO2981361.1 hypothetical protein [Mycobacteroides abscessus subsp. abscessus]OBK68463.1 hypothetical protein A5654_14795 [Mycolicibacterium fortuitum]